MAHDNYDREPRWERPGYGVDRQGREREPEEQNWEGDRSLSRNYNREEMRRYGRKSVDQGERIREARLRPEPWDSQQQPYGEGRRINRSGQAEQGQGWARPPRMGRQPSENWERNRDYPGHISSRNRFRDEDFDYDAERDYRGYHAGRNMNMEGSGEPGHEMRDPYRSRDVDRDRGGQSRRRRYEMNRARQANTPGRDTARDTARDAARDTHDNFWGEREQGRRYRVRDRDAWWNNEGGRSDVTSARGYGNDIPTGPNYDWLEDRSYDFDPGYAYEFGTDFDFLNDVPARTQERDAQERRREQMRHDQPRRGQPQRQEQGRGQQPRSQRGQNQQPGQGTWAEMDYGWQGSPERMQARYREIWDIPGPYAGMGPKGYTRPDETILDEICKIFTNNGQINASGIEVQVKNGLVTLEGNVDRKEEKYLVEDIASSISGVKDVNNRLRVQARLQANEGARGRGMDREETMTPRRIQPGMRVAGVDGKNIGQVRETRENGFILNREGGGDTFIPYRAIKRMNGQIILHVHGNEIDRQGWKE